MSPEGVDRVQPSPCGGRQGIGGGVAARLAGKARTAMPFWAYCVTQGRIQGDCDGMQAAVAGL